MLRDRWWALFLIAGRFLPGNVHVDLFICLSFAPSRHVFVVSMDGDVGQTVSGESAPIAVSVLGAVGQEIGAVGTAGATSSWATSNCMGWQWCIGSRCQSRDGGGNFNHI